MDYLTEITVRGYHADFYGHVNNARFLEFFEEDRWARFEESIDLPGWAKEGFVFLVVNINVNYRKAVAVGEKVVVVTRLHEVGDRSAVLKQEVLFKKNLEVAADALVTFVVIDKSGRAVPIGTTMQEELEKLRVP